LANTVLKLAGEHQEKEARNAAVLDDPALAPNTAAPDNTVTGTTITQTPMTQVQTQEQQEDGTPAASTEQPAVTVTTNVPARESNPTMPPPPVRTNQDTQDDSTEFMEFLELNREAQQPQRSARELLLEALHVANEKGEDINGIIDVFSEQMHDRPPTAAAPAANPMDRPIPKKQRGIQETTRAGFSSTKQATSAHNPNLTCFQAMFPAEATARSVPLPNYQQMLGGSFPGNMITAADNVQMMGFQPQGMTEHGLCFIPSGSSIYLFTDHYTDIFWSFS